MTCETCPQYLVLDESRYTLPDFEGVKYVMSPPLRTIQDQMALKDALVNGLFQTIGSDHCSFTFNDQKLKSRHDFTRIPGGIPGAEERGIIAYDVLVNQCNMSAVDFMKLVSETRKALRYVSEEGNISVGKAMGILQLLISALSMCFQKSPPIQRLTIYLMRAYPLQVKFEM